MAIRMVGYVRDPNEMFHIVSMMSPRSAHFVHRFKFRKKSCSAFLSRDATGPERAIVFVHGFGGSAVGTWRGFDRHAETDPYLASSDLYFLGYRSINRNLYECASDVKDFVDIVWPHPHQLVRPTEDVVGAAVDERDDALSDRGTYRDLTLVGHSEGGVLVRMALVRFLQEDQSVPSARVRLFAPALGGVNLSGVKGTAGKLVAPLLHFSGAFNDLADGSLVLGQLARDTERAAETWPPTHVNPFRSVNLWATRDSVVSPMNYYEDNGRRSNRPTSHTSVAKPKGEFVQPLEIVRE